MKRLKYLLGALMLASNMATAAEEAVAEKEMTVFARRLEKRLRPETG